MHIDELTSLVIGCAQNVHNTLSAGFLEKVYENALCIERVNAGLDVKQQHPITIWYKDQIVGDYCADILVENRLIVELKAIQQLVKEHEVQLVHYLTATRIDHGLLINFGRSVEARRKFRLYKDTHRTTLDKLGQY